MAEQLTLEQAAANVAKSAEKIDLLRKQRIELNDQMAQLDCEWHDAYVALDGAKQTLIQIALQTKGER